MAALSISLETHTQRFTLIACCLRLERSKRVSIENTPEGWKDLYLILMFLEAKIYISYHLGWWNMHLICIKTAFDAFLYRRAWNFINNSAVWWIGVMYTPHKINGFNCCSSAAVKSYPASLTTQSVNATGANRKQRPILNMWPANCWALSRTCHMPIWCFIIVYINGTKLNFSATEMTSQAYAPIWHDGPCLPRLQ